MIQLLVCALPSKEMNPTEKHANMHILCYAWVQGNKFFLITPTLLFSFSFSSICLSVLCYCYIFEGDINESYMINFSYLLNIFCFASSLTNPKSTVIKINLDHRFFPKSFKLVRYRWDT